MFPRDSPPRTVLYKMNVSALNYKEPPPPDNHTDGAFYNKA